MKQFVCLLTVAIWLITGSNYAIAQSGGQLPQKKDAHSKTYRGSSMFENSRAAKRVNAKWKRESDRKMREYAQKYGERERDLGMDELFDKKPHESNPKKALRQAQRRDRLRDRNSGVAQHFDEQLESTPRKYLRQAQEKERKRERNSGVDAFFK